MKKRQVIGVFGGEQLPYATVKVRKDATGKRVIEGVFTFQDEHPNVPFGREVNGEYIAYTYGERQRMIAEKVRKQERAAKKAAKNPVAPSVKGGYWEVKGFDGSSLIKGRKQSAPKAPERSPYFLDPHQ